MSYSLLKFCRLCPSLYILPLGDAPPPPRCTGLMQACHAISAAQFSSELLDEEGKEGLSGNDNKQTAALVKDTKQFRTDNTSSTC